MIMHLNAHSALAAVERSRGSHELAGVAVAQLVLLFLWFHVTRTIVDVWVENLGQVFELSQVEKLVDTVSYAELLKL